MKHWKTVQPNVEQLSKSEHQTLLLVNNVEFLKRLKLRNIRVRQIDSYENLGQNMNLVVWGGIRSFVFSSTKLMLSWLPWKTSCALQLLSVSQTMQDTSNIKSVFSMLFVRKRIPVKDLCVRIYFLQLWNLLFPSCSSVL